MIHRPLAAALFVIALAVPAAAQKGESDSVVFEDVQKADFFKEGLAPVRKSGPYDVTIVYFMDYQCPSCRQYTPDVARVLKEDSRVRVIYRDAPMLGPKSNDAARLAIASQFQGKHEAFHHALMTSKGRLSDQTIREAADRAGVDWARLQRDLDARRSDIDMVIARNLELSSATGISGTPAFIVGDTLANGALTYAALKAEIADARNANGGKAATPATAPETKEPALPTAQANVPGIVDEATPQAAPAPIFAPAASPAIAADSVTASQPAAGTSSTPWLAMLGAGLVAGLAALAIWMRRRSRA